MTIKTFTTFDPKWDEKVVLSVGVNWLEEVHYNLDKGVIEDFNGMFASFSNDNGLRSEYIKGYCHANLSSLGMGSDFIATLSHKPKYCNRESYDGEVGKYQYDKDTVHRFYDWLVNRSFASGYIHPMPVEFCAERGLIISSDIPANLLAAICIVSRQKREKYGWLKGWAYLQDKYGLSEDLSFFIVNSFNLFKSTDADLYDGFVVKTGSVYNHASGHNIFDQFEDVDIWMTREFQKLKLIFRKSVFYQGVNAMFRKTPYNGLIKIQDMYNSEKKAKEDKPVVKSVVQDPFTPRQTVASNQSRSVSYDYFMQELLPFLKEKYDG